MEEREAPEHPARALVRRDQRMANTDPRQLAGELEAARPGADDHDLVVARRMGFSVIVPAERIAQAPRLAEQQPVHHLRIAEEERLEVLRRQHDAAERRRGDDVRDRRLVEEDRQLAEPVAALEEQRSRRDHGRGGPVDELAVDAPLGLAVEDDVEAAADEALPLGALARLEPLLLEGLCDLVQLRRRQVCEQGDPGEIVRSVGLARQCEPPLSFRPTLVQFRVDHQQVRGRGMAQIRRHRR